MTKRLTAVALCLAVALAFAGGTAEAKGPTLRDAQKLARALAQKQVRDRKIVSFHILKGTRTKRGAVVFPYDDRSATNVFCVASIVVSQRTVRGRVLASAQFRGSRCKNIPTEALAYEAAVRGAQRSLRATEPASRSAVGAISAALVPCKKLKVPKARAAAARLLVQVAVTEAIAKPNDATLATFVSLLASIQTGDPVLAAGAAGWTDYLAVLRALPAIQDPCAPLKAWAAHKWALSAAPAGLSTFSAANSRAAGDQIAIGRAAKVLASDGVVPAAVVGFTPQGLLFALVPKVGITGG